MIYRVMMHLDVVAKDGREAVDVAKKLGELLKNPMVRMAIQGENIRLASGDGQPVVYEPQPYV
jgi:uncharacterized protein YajQ (UPF0234 family)